MTPQTSCSPCGDRPHPSSGGRSGPGPPLTPHPSGSGPGSRVGCCGWKKVWAGERGREDAGTLGVRGQTQAGLCLLVLTGGGGRGAGGRCQPCSSVPALGTKAQHSPRVGWRESGLLLVLPGWGVRVGSTSGGAGEAPRYFWRRLEEPQRCQPCLEVAPAWVLRAEVRDGGRYLLNWLPCLRPGRRGASVPGSEWTVNLSATGAAGEGGAGEAGESPAWKMVQ